MKKIISVFVLSMLAVVGFAQDYGNYSLPHTTDLSVLQQYVGQKVKVFKYNGYRSIYGKDGHDEYIFEHKLGGRVNTIYTIQKVKTGSQIVLELVDGRGKKVKAKINANGEHNYKGMQSCKSFFLVDKFETDQATVKGKIIKNENGEDVATVTGYDMVTTKDSYPTLSYVIKSNFYDASFSCDPKLAETYCKKIGTTLSNPKVKATYQIVGLEVVLPKSRYESVKKNYIAKNSVTGVISKCSMSNPNSVFEEDLSGHYISVLTKVEKPSNPAIRYGKTTTIEDDKKISKYSYVDNVIDILIFGGSKQFDFILKNVSENTIKIVWNEAVFVNFDGSSSKVMHVGTKYSQREADQPATTVIKGAKIEDLAAPNCNVRYSDVLKEWVTDSMYPMDPALSPGELRLMLPIQIKDVVNEYIFVFDVQYVYSHPDRLNL